MVVVVVVVVVSSLDLNCVRVRRKLREESEWMESTTGGKESM